MAEQSEAKANRRKAVAGFPQDRFDDISSSGRVGAHRVIARPRYFWQYFIAGVAGFVILTGAGLFWLYSIGPSSGSGDSKPGNSAGANSAPVVPDVDPDAQVVVLNGTSTASLATAVDRKITAEEWGTIIFSGDAASHDVQISAVFYSDPKNKAAAAGLAGQLGGLSTYVTNDYDAYEAELVVLLGSDYSGPGFDDAAKIAKSTTEAPADGEAPSGAADDNEEPSEPSPAE